MLSAIAQPHPLCYLPHLCCDQILPSNNNNISFKEIRIHITTCLEIFEKFVFLEGPKSTSIDRILGPLNSGKLRQQLEKILAINK
jgi:hypothetical protein